MMTDYLKRKCPNWLYSELLDLLSHLESLKKLLPIGLSVALLLVIAFSSVSFTNPLSIYEIANDIFESPLEKVLYYELTYTITVFQWMIYMVTIIVLGFFFFGYYFLFIFVKIVLKILYKIFHKDINIIKVRKFLENFFVKRYKIEFRPIKILFLLGSIVYLVSRGVDFRNLPHIIDTFFYLIVAAVIVISSSFVIINYNIRRLIILRYRTDADWYDKIFYSIEAIRRELFTFSTMILFIIMLFNLYIPLCLDRIDDFVHFSNYQIINKYHYEEKYQELIRNLDDDKIRKLKLSKINITPSNELIYTLYPFYNPSHSDYYLQLKKVVINRLLNILLIFLLIFFISKLILTIIFHPETKLLLKAIMWSTIKSSTLLTFRLPASSCSS